MYRLNVDGVEIYVIVTRNVFSHRLSVYRKYDLKVRLASVIGIKWLKRARPYRICCSYCVNEIIQMHLEFVSQSLLLQSWQPIAV